MRIWIQQVENAEADPDPQPWLRNNLLVIFLLLSFSRCFTGLFSTPKYLFPRKVCPVSISDIEKYSSMVQLGDQISDSVVIRGTTYRAGFLVLTKAFSEDLLQVGEVVKIVLRKSSLLMLVVLSEAVRNEKLGFFEALPSEKVSLVSYDSLADYKPIIKRGDSHIYPFVLHHHVSPPPFEDGKKKIIYLSACLYAALHLFPSACIPYRT